MKKYSLLIFFSLICAFGLLALQSARYLLRPQATGPGGTKSGSTSYQSVSCGGQASSTKQTSANYINISGFAGALLGGSNNPPSIGNLEFDGQAVIDQDYIKQNAELTATVLDLEGSISPEASRIIINGAATAFSALSGTNSFTPATGALAYQLNLADGTHTIQISAVDNAGLTTAVARTVKVDSGGARAANAFVYPNPYDPAAGNLRIAYQLNQDAAITLYLFNEINQLVWKTVCAAGTTGGRSGYNEVLWNGTTDFGRRVGNGAYFLRIVSGGKQIGKVKLAVLR